MALERDDWGKATMNADEIEADYTAWGQAEQSLLLLAREQEWAEAYAVDNPHCPMGRMYLEFLHREMIRAMGDL